MKYILRTFWVALVAAAAVSCYDDYVQDYEYSTVCFATQKPLRTVIADRDMTIKVGVSIGGKREVDTDDWAVITVDESLLAGSGLTLLPPSYYSLPADMTLRVSRGNMPVADAELVLTDLFFNDPLAAGKHYALPLRIVSSSLDRTVEGKGYSVVAVKYQSDFCGTYYVSGSVYDLAVPGTVTTYPSSGQTLTRELTTLSRMVLKRPGVANGATGSDQFRLTFNNYTGGRADVAVSTLSGPVAIVSGSGTYDGTLANPEIKVSYDYTKDGKTYHAAETYVLRQDPAADLRFEEW